MMGASQSQQQQIGTLKKLGKFKASTYKKMKTKGTGKEGDEVLVESNEQQVMPDATESIDAAPTNIPSADNSKDVEMEDTDDHCRAEGSIVFEVKNVSKIKDTALSDPVMIRNLPWRVMLIPRFYTNQNGERVKKAGIFVQCDPEGEGASWSCQAHSRITLRNHKGDDFTRKITHVYFAKENDWGYSSFIPWADIIDSKKGYNKNDTVTIEAFIQAEAPHGVLSMRNGNCLYNSVSIFIVGSGEVLCHHLRADVLIELSACWGFCASNVSTYDGSDEYTTKKDYGQKILCEN